MLLYTYLVKLESPAVADNPRDVCSSVARFLCELFGFYL